MMDDWTPDRWIVVRIDNAGEIYNKLLVEWKGGYLDGDYWRMNSGIAAVEEEGDYWLFHGRSGSVYRCHKGRYGVTGEAHRILCSLLDKNSDTLRITDLTVYTDWTKLEMMVVE
jgi:hypothetical protein